jgi:hypothetical protein
MPNGNPHFHSDEEPKLESFFAKISGELLSFASRHDLKLEKYYHQAPTWSFGFRHPVAGVAKIDVEKHSDAGIKIWSHWWRDDYDAGIRFLKVAESPMYQIGTLELTSVLEETLTRILIWKEGEWDNRHGGYQEIWHKTWTREVFEAMINNYPLVKV